MVGLSISSQLEEDLLLELILILQAFLESEEWLLESFHGGLKLFKTSFYSDYVTFTTVRAVARVSTRLPIWVAPRAVRDWGSICVLAGGWNLDVSISYTTSIYHDPVTWIQVTWHARNLHLVFSWLIFVTVGTWQWLDLVLLAVPRTSWRGRSALISFLQYVPRDSMKRWYHVLTVGLVYKFITSLCQRYDLGCRCEFGRS
jgi:hypothetical protein